MFVFSNVTRANVDICVVAGTGSLVSDGITRFGPTGLPSTNRAEAWQASSGARLRRIEHGSDYYPATVVLMRQMQALVESLNQVFKALLSSAKKLVANPYNS